MRTVRYGVGAAGIALMTFGGALLWDGPRPWSTALWLAGGVLVHDGLLAPLVLAVGAVAGILAGRPPRGVPRAALIVAGSLTAVALPALLRPDGVANATVLPLDYSRNWLLAMAAVAVTTTGYAGARAGARWARRSGGAGRGRKGPGVAGRRP
ncbi:MULTISPECIES: hypothetical protein [unclassified Streptomyces]|uniref:hypothetical protein n=1 Tax=unclassified Streptomyces TaxID=2593676 RepID=UPI0007C94720|nr:MULTISPECIES: hypothetical protein [unclassified Streptomyces]